MFERAEVKRHRNMDYVEWGDFKLLLGSPRKILDEVCRQLNFAAEAEKLLNTMLVPWRPPHETPQNHWAVAGVSAVEALLAKYSPLALDQKACKDAWMEYNNSASPVPVTIEAFWGIYQIITAAERARHVAATITSATTTTDSSCYVPLTDDEAAKKWYEKTWYCGCGNAGHENRDKLVVPLMDAYKDGRRDERARQQ